MPDHPTPDWAIARRRYEETQDDIADICRDAGLDPRDLANRRRREKWRRQNPRPFPAARLAPAARRSGPEPEPSTRASAAASGTAGDRSASPLSTRQTSPRSAVPPRRPPTSPVARRRLLDRLVQAISLKLEQLERQMIISLDTETADPTSATDHERETRAIGALIDNLEKVTEMETGLGSQKSGRGSSGAAVPTDLAREAERCRRELAERLSRLVEAAASET